MKWIEGKYEHRWRHTDSFWAWMDLLHVIALTFCIAIGLACLIILLLAIMNPKLTSADDWVNLRVATRGSMSPSQGSPTDVSAVVLHKTPLVESKPVAHPAPVVKSVSRSKEPVKILYMEVSAYSPAVAECDGNPLRTASGKKVYVGGIAADLRVLPFGSIVTIPNYNGGKPCTVVDTGGAIKGLKLDVFLWSAHEAIHWGRRKNVRVEVLYIPR